MKVLYTSPILEHPAAGGPQLRIENSIIALNKVCELHVLSGVQKEKIGGASAETFFQSNSCCFEYLPSSTIKLSNNRYIRKIQSVLRKLTIQWTIKNDANFIINYAKKNNINILWLGYGNISYPLIKEIKRKSPKHIIVCDTDSVWSRFVLRELPFISDPVRRRKIEKIGKLKEREEKEWVNLCDVTTAVSEVDAIYYRSLTSDMQKIHLFSNVINLNSYKKKPSPPLGFKTPSIYLAGTFGHYNSPMDEAARWVINKILPIVRNTIPDVNLYIVGRESDKFYGQLKESRIYATGKVDTVLPYLYNTEVALVPLKFESGTRFKILEAGACKVPIVSTTLGAEGIPVIDGKHVLIGDNEIDFANAIIKLLKDRKLAKKLAQNCNQIINDQFSIETLSIEAEKILSYLKEC